jgi:hypothetical protein
MYLAEQNEHVLDHEGHEAHERVAESSLLRVYEGFVYFVVNSP